MRKCVECRSTDLTHSKEQMPFNEVALVEATLHRCNSCGASYHDFSRVGELSREVAHLVARQEQRLLPAQIRFLRKYLGYSGKDFADFLAVAPETVSRWESKQSPMVMQLSTEKLIRLMAVTADALAEYGLDRIGHQAGDAPRPLLQERAGHWHLVVSDNKNKVGL